MEDVGRYSNWVIMNIIYYPCYPIKHSKLFKKFNPFLHINLMFISLWVVINVALNAHDGRCSLSWWTNVDP